MQPKQEKNANYIFIQKKNTLLRFFFWRLCDSNKKNTKMKRKNDSQNAKTKNSKNCKQPENSKKLTNKPVNKSKKGKSFTMAEKWLEVREKLIELCPEFATALKQKRQNRRASAYVSTISDAIKKILEIIKPFSIDEEPPAFVLTQLCEIIHRGDFGYITPNNRIVPKLRKLNEGTKGSTKEASTKEATKESTKDPGGLKTTKEAKKAIEADGPKASEAKKASEAEAKKASEAEPKKASEGEPKKASEEELKKDKKRKRKQEKSTVVIHPAILKCFDKACALSKEEEFAFQRMTKLKKQHCLAITIRRCDVLQVMWSLRQFIRDKSNKHDKSNKQSSLRDIVQNLELRDAAIFCLRQRKMVYSRIVFLLANNISFSFAELEEKALLYKDYWSELTRLLFQIPELKHLTVHLPSAVTNRWFLLMDTIGPPKIALQNKTLKEISAAIVSLGHGRQHILTVFCEGLRELGEIQMAQDLKNQHGPKASQLATKSSWHKNVMEDFVCDIEAHSHLTSNLDRQLRRLTDRFTRFILDLDDFAEKTKSVSLQSFFETCTLLELESAIRHYLKARKAQNDRVKSTAATHYAAPYASFAIRVFNGTLRKHLLGCKDQLCQLTVMGLLRSVPNKRRSADPNMRRTFTQQEIDSMLKAAQNPSETFLITLLREIAPRNTAIACLKYDDVLDEKHEPRSLCSLREKGNKIRKFAPSTNLKSKIKNLSDFLRSQYPDSQLKKAYILNLRDIQQPGGTVLIGNILTRLANDAGIKDVRVHPHAFRHTLVGALMEAGNSLEITSKFIGHSNPATTSYFYWLPTAEQLNQHVINPFQTPKKPFEQKENDIILEAANAKVRACRRIIDIALSEVTVKNRLCQQIANLQEIIDTIDTPLALSSYASVLSTNQTAQDEAQPEEEEEEKRQEETNNQQEEETENFDAFM